MASVILRKPHPRSPSGRNLEPLKARVKKLSTSIAVVLPRRAGVFHLRIHRVFTGLLFVNFGLSGLAGIHASRSEIEGSPLAATSWIPCPELSIGSAASCPAASSRITGTPRRSVKRSARKSLASRATITQLARRCLAVFFCGPSKSSRAPVFNLKHGF